MNHKTVGVFCLPILYDLSEISKFYRVPLHCGVTKVPGDALGIVLAGLRDTKLIKRINTRCVQRKYFRPTYDNTLGPHNMHCQADMI
jgi:hypothetical protein